MKTNGELYKKPTKKQAKKKQGAIESDWDE